MFEILVQEVMRSVRSCSLRRLYMYSSSKPYIFHPIRTSGSVFLMKATHLIRSSRSFSTHSHMSAPVSAVLQGATHTACFKYWSVPYFHNVVQMILIWSPFWVASGKMVGSSFLMFQSELISNFSWCLSRVALLSHSISKLPNTNGAVACLSRRGSTSVYLAEML